jgi:hypothetical protein
MDSCTTIDICVSKIQKDIHTNEDGTVIYKLFDYCCDYGHSFYQTLENIAKFEIIVMI